LPYAHAEIDIMYGTTNNTLKQCGGTNLDDQIDWSSFPYFLYNMSYLWYQITGTFIAVASSVIFSLVFRMSYGRCVFHGVSVGPERYH
jgi:hypothetical protein